MSNRRNKREEFDHPYQGADVDAPAFMGPDGEFSSGTQYLDMLMYAPYGKGNLGYYWKELVANVVLKEGLAVLFVSFLLPSIVATAPGPDPVSRAIFIGLIAALSIIAMLSWGYNDRLPRHLTAGATVAEFIGGSINWFIAILYVGVGILFSVVGAAVLYASGSSTIPIIGTPNNQTIGTTFLIQFLFTIAIALTVLDQYTTRRGKPRIFKQRSTSDPTGIAPFRAYQEDIGARPYVYGIIVWLIVTFNYLKFGLWSFNSYTYFAGALGLQFLGCGINSWNNVNCLVPQGNYVAGAGALFILTDVLAWIVALAINALLYRWHNNEPRLPEDDSSYAMKSNVGEDYEESEQRRQRRNQKASAAAAARKRITSNQSPAIEAHFNMNAADWTGEK